MSSGRFENIGNNREEMSSLLDSEKPIISETINYNKSIIERNFLNEFQEKGFEILREIPSFPSPDPTVMFVGAQISHWKKFLKEKEKIRFANPQNCIRLQNSKLFYNDEEMRFCSSFRTEGAISNMDSLGEMLKMATNYLVGLGVDPGRIAIKTNDELLAQIDVNDFEIINNTEKPDYYNWTYGDQNLTGLGLTLAIKNERNNSPYDIGNVIQIYDNDEPIAVEWGFGQETLMTAIYSEDCPIKFADLPDKYRELLGDKKHYKLLDALSTICEMSQYGVIPGKAGARKMCKEYVRGAAYQFELCDINRRFALEMVNDFANYNRLELDVKNNLSNQIEKYLGRISYVKELYIRGEDMENEILVKRTGLPEEVINVLKERKKNEK